MTQEGASKKIRWVRPLPITVFATFAFAEVGERVPVTLGGPANFKVTHKRWQGSQFPSPDTITEYKLQEVK